MRARSLSHLSDGELLSALEGAEARDRCTTADIVSHLAEVDRRKLYVRAGYPSMFNWCIETRHYSEDVASKRIRAIRAVRRFPVILDMIADGRLHLSAVALLARRLTHENAEELLTACTRRSKRWIERMLAERFPESDAPTLVEGIQSANILPAPGPVSNLPLNRESDAPAPASSTHRTPVASAGDVAESAPAPVVATPSYSRIAPSAPQRYRAQFTMDEGMYADLCRAQELIGPTATDDRVREVFRRALQALVAKLEKQKFAATSRPRASRKPSDSRHIPAELKRQVVQRDGGRCSWVSGDGHRCDSREALEFDHVTPVSLGGESTLENLRLLCRAHNQYEAERAFGEGFMHRTRERAQDARATAAPG